MLCCLQLLSTISIALAGGEETPGEETLIVGPTETLSFRTPEAGAGLEAALDGGLLKPIGQTLTAPAAGDHWLAVAGRDGAGNLSPIRWIRLRVDSEPPRVDLWTEPMPVDRNRRWMPPRAAVTASAEDDLAGIAGLFLAVGDEVREVRQRSVMVELPPEGEAAVRAWVVDRAGNRSAESTLDLTIDATPPSGEIRVGCSPAPGTAVVATAVVATAVVAPDCRIDVEVVDRESGGVTWTPRIDGEDAPAGELGGPWVAGAHVVEVQARDAVGNEARVGPR